MENTTPTPIEAGDYVLYAGTIYKVAEIKDFPHGKMIGIYDEPPSNHIDYVKPESVIKALNPKIMHISGKVEPSAIGLINKMVDMVDKTTIEKWIEENSGNFGGKLILDAMTYTIACHELLTYLGLQGIDDPKLWIDEYKTMESLHKESSHTIRMQAIEQEQLKAENESLKKALMKIYTFDINYVNDMQAIFQFREIAEQAHPDLNKNKNEL